MKRRRWVRSSMASAVVVVAVGALGFLGIKGGYPATRPRLLSGAAWLASSKVGQLTLLDGSSAEVAGQVQVATPGDGVDAVQQGSNAYAVSRSAGTVRRVDGATFTVGDPVTPIPGTTTDLRVFAGPGAVYALDTGRGVLAEADPGTLAPRGGLVSMATQTAAGATSIDDHGRLWVLDSGTGVLDWIGDGRRHPGRQVVPGGSGLLTLAGGKPVVVDPRGRSALTLDPDSTDVVNRTSLDLRPDDRIAVSGSPDATRLYVVASRGVLDVCDLTASACSTAVALGATGADLGAAVESAGRVFVPDYSAGRVWIVDLAGLRVVAQPEVLPPGTRFQLLTRDSVVFFNDPDSERAGVIRFDGGVHPVAKYDPHNPAGTTQSPGPATSSSSPPAKQPPKPKTPGTKTPTPTPTPTPTGTGTPGPPPLPDLALSVSANPSHVGETVTVTVSTGGAPHPVNAQWDFGDATTPGQGLSTSHSWTSIRTFLVTVTATFPDGRTKQRSYSQRVVAVPPPMGTLTVHVVGPGTIASSPKGISCKGPGTCSAQFVAGTSVHLSANPNVGAQFEEYADDCTGATPPDCDLVVPQSGATVTGTFTQTDWQLTVRVQDPKSGGGGGSIHVTENDGAGSDQVCNTSRCTFLFPIGMTVLLSPDPLGLSVSQFKGWTGACAGSGQSCHLTMDGAKSTTALYVRCPPGGCT